MCVLLEDAHHRAELQGDPLVVAFVNIVDGAFELFRDFDTLQEHLSAVGRVCWADWRLKLDNKLFYFVVSLLHSCRVTFETTRDVWFSRFS